jgi:hypothetical protein
VQEKLLSCSAQIEEKVALAFCALCVVAIKKSFRRRSSATIFHLPLDGNKVSQALPKL